MNDFFTGLNEVEPMEDNQFDTSEIPYGTYLCTLEKFYYDPEWSKWKMYFAICEGDHEGRFLFFDLGLNPKGDNESEKGFLFRQRVCNRIRKDLEMEYNMRSEDFSSDTYLANFVDSNMRFRIKKSKNNKRPEYPYINYLGRDASAEAPF